MKEHVFSLNAFNMPKVFDQADAGYVLIVRLLLLDPGKFQSHPEMGVGLRTRYRFNNDDDLLQTLQNDIRNQMIKYLPEIATTEVRLVITRNNELGIIIDTSDGSYVLSYNNTSDTLDTAASYVLDNL